MEIKTLSFFGENGITSTSANHIANLAKEAVRSAHEKLAAIRFYSETVGLLTSDKEARIKTGLSKDGLEIIPKFVSAIAEANSLIAFLREAIKEKERRAEQAETYTDTASRQANALNLKALRESKPVKESYPSEEDVRMSWTIGEQEKYLSLEAEAAALGKLVHEDGHLSRARIELMKVVETPQAVQLNGSETLVHNFTPTVSVDDVNEVFNNLQKRYRKVQAELNGMKKKVQDTLDTEKMRIDQEYAKAVREYNAYEASLVRAMNEIENQEEIHRKELLKEVQGLKIVIPNRFKELVDGLLKK